jgi:hypothetical protein
MSPSPEPHPQSFFALVIFEIGSCLCPNWPPLVILWLSVRNSATLHLLTSSKLLKIKDTKTSWTNFFNCLSRSISERYKTWRLNKNLHILCVYIYIYIYIYMVFYLHDMIYKAMLGMGCEKAQFLWFFWPKLVRSKRRLSMEVSMPNLYCTLMMWLQYSLSHSKCLE